MGRLEEACAAKDPCEFPPPTSCAGLEVGADLVCAARQGTKDDAAKIMRTPQRPLPLEMKARREALARTGEHEAGQLPTFDRRTNGF